MTTDSGADEHAYKYDVAFSFLARDEGLAQKLGDLIRDRVSTFIYSERQKELAGTDGEEAFGRVFREESRLVVVLYRAGWGESKWTRVEQTAIRARGFDHGYGFAKFIPLDEPTRVPQWLPPTQIYIGLKRFGIDGAAAVIEQRVRDLGGLVHHETVEEHAQRVEREISFQKRQAAFRREPGVEAARQGVAGLRQELEKRATAVKTSTSIDLRVIDRPDGFWLFGLGRALGVSWRPVYFNTLDDAKLEVVLLSHLPPGPGQFMFERPSRVEAMKFVFDLLPGDLQGWVAEDARGQTFATEDLAEHLVKYYLTNGRK